MGDVCVNSFKQKDDSLLQPVVSSGFCPKIKTKDSETLPKDSSVWFLSQSLNESGKSAYSKKMATVCWNSDIFGITVIKKVSVFNLPSSDDMLDEKKCVDSPVSNSVETKELI